MSTSRHGSGAFLKASGLFQCASSLSVTRRSWPPEDGAAGTGQLNPTRRKPTAAPVRNFVMTNHQQTLLRLPFMNRIIIFAYLLLSTACATTGATLNSGVGDRLIEHPPWYAGAGRDGSTMTIAHLPVL